jgi:hypothetical protein
VVELILNVPEALGSIPRTKKKKKKKQMHKTCILFYKIFINDVINKIVQDYEKVGRTGA